MELNELFAGREKEIEAMQDRLLKAAAAEGLSLAKRTHTYNSRLAQELGKWAEAQGKFDDYRQAVYRAYFVEGKNIAQVDELIKIVESINLPAEDARQVIESKRFAAAVDADWQRARELGVTAVPTHFCGENKLVGFNPYVEFLDLISNS